MNKTKIEIDYRLLERIAEYYEFPMAVFILPFRKFPEGTRKQYWQKKIGRLIKILEKFLNEIK